MTTFQIIAVVIALTAAVSYVNARFWKLPSSVALMATALVGAAVLVGLDAVGAVAVTSSVREIVGRLDFGNTLLHGMLGLLLFAGALHVDVGTLGAERYPVALLALGGTLLSTAIVGIGVFALLHLLGHQVGLVEALLFGALIAPTDPIAVLGMLKSAHAPKRLEVRIAGESLFNDGIGVVIFTVLLAAATGREASVSDGLILFAREAVGGGVFGLAAGYTVLRLMRPIDDYAVEVLLTLALVVVGYTAAEWIHVSAPIGAVVAGLVIGNKGPRAMSDVTRDHVDMFWKLIDEILNAVLFLMIGLTALLVPLSRDVIGAALLAVPLVLVARWLAVTASLGVVPSIRTSIPHSIKLLTWGGLRGGLSIAMALALPAGGSRDIILVMTYAVVAFSILVQGLSFGWLLRRLGIASPGATP